MKWNVNVERKITDITPAAAKAQIEVADKQYAAPARYKMITGVSIVGLVLLVLVISLCGVGWDAEKLAHLQGIFIAALGVAGVTVYMTFKGKPPGT